MKITRFLPAAFTSKVADVYNELKRRCPLRIKKSYSVSTSLYSKRKPSKPLVDLSVEDSRDVSLVDVLLIAAAVIIVLGVLHSLSYKRR